MNSRLRRESLRVGRRESFVNLWVPRVGRARVHPLPDPPDTHSPFLAMRILGSFNMLRTCRAGASPSPTELIGK